MNCPVYTFGPNAHPAAAISMKDALAETFPTFKFDVELVASLTGTHEGVVLRGSASSGAFERMVMFARGYVAGFGGGNDAPTEVEARQRALTRTDCPAAKRKSDPPPPSEPTLPSQPSPLPGRIITRLGIPASRPDQR